MAIAFLDVMRGNPDNLIVVFIYLFFKASINHSSRSPQIELPVIACRSFAYLLFNFKLLGL